MTGIKEILLEEEPFLVIGGHAVILHGYPRTTVDFAMLIPEGSEMWWQRRLVEGGWQQVHSTESFIQFKGNEGRPPVDLMIVDGPTFAKLSAGSQSATLFGVEVRLPNPEHLVALKLHAIRQPARLRVEQDWSDVVGLIQSCGLDPEDRDFHSLINQYGGEEAHKEIQRRSRG